jgi:hypothetical protein
MNARAKNKKIASASTKVESICRAIEKIPCRNGVFNAREAFGTFIQHALCSITVANKHIGEPLFLTHANFELLGFSRIDLTLPDTAYAEILVAVDAYMRAVKTNPPFTDLLTPIHAHFLGANGKGLGQFFTPWDLAKLCSALAIDHQQRHGEPSPVRMSDPCCGAGGLLLAYIQDRLYDRKQHPAEPGGDVYARFERAINTRVHANDIDPLCSAMTALQLCASQFVHMLDGTSLGSVEIEVGCTLTGKKVVAFRSMSRFKVPKGVATMGTKVGLMDMLAVDQLARTPEQRRQDYVNEQELVLSNPPFGALQNEAWEVLRERWASEVPSETVEKQVA